MTKRQIIEDIRTQYSGLKDMPRESLASSVKTLADDLYAKDFHFIFELIQNAEDNEYGAGVVPSLRFVLDTIELGGQATPALIIENNEKGFEEKNVRAVCQVGQSTKKKAEGYIGEKGIGFKSVFRVTKCPYVFSNGFNFSLPKEDADTGLGYIVPVWQSQVPDTLNPNSTNIVLPLNDTAKTLNLITEALKDIASETILFLTKIKSICVEINLNEKYWFTINRDDTQLPLIELSHTTDKGQEAGLSEASTSLSQYWFASHNFQRPDDVVSEKRLNILSRQVTVALPLGSGKHPHPGKLFAYLPVWNTTGLPFLINADFLLVSSREGIRENESWNLWLRDCISEVFVDAFLSLLQGTEISLDDKLNVYAALPVESHVEFLRPIVSQIQEALKVSECVVAGPQAKLCVPSTTRSASRGFREVFEREDLPKVLREEFLLVHRDIEKYHSALKAIGVPALRIDVLMKCLEDTTWLSGLDFRSLLLLYRYLPQNDFGKHGLIEFPIIPVAESNDASWTFVAALGNPVYLPCDDVEESLLESAPSWILARVPVKFFSRTFFEYVMLEEDAKKIIAWMGEQLGVHEFSLGMYCIDVLYHLSANQGELTNGELVSASDFLVQSDDEMEWEELPLVLGDGTRIMLAESRTRNVQIVVPETYDLAEGWATIWRRPEERKHFCSLSAEYHPATMERLIELKVIARFPLPERACRKYTPISVTEVSINYLAPDNLHEVASASLLSWLRHSLDVRIVWPCSEYNFNYSWVRSLGDIEWAYKKTYFMQGDKIYENRTGKYEFLLGYSDFLKSLRTSPWLPTTKGKQAPERSFLPLPGNKEMLGDTVPYVTDELPPSAVSLLGICPGLSIVDVIKLLQKCSEERSRNHDLFRRLYSHLEASFRYGKSAALNAFRDSPIVFVPSETGAKEWHLASELVWSDSAGVMDGELIAIENIYPELKSFFLNTLEVLPEPDPECCANKWLSLQDSENYGEEATRVLVERLYRSIKTVLAQPETQRPGWWKTFRQSARLYSHAGKFVAANQIVVPDDEILKGLFADCEIEYSWRLPNESFNDALPFYKAFGVPVLSECVSEHLVDSLDDFPVEQSSLVTPSVVKMVAAWLREKRSGTYEKLLSSGAFKELARVTESRVSKDILVEFRFELGGVKISRSVEYPVFWDRKKNVLIFNSDTAWDQIAQALAKGLIKGAGHKDLADWIELILESSGEVRLRKKGWNVPQEILDMYRDGILNSDQELLFEHSSGASPEVELSGSKVEPEVSSKDGEANQPAAEKVPSPPPAVSVSAHVSSKGSDSAGATGNEATPSRQPADQANLGQTKPTRQKPPVSEYSTALALSFQRGGATQFDEDEEYYDESVLVKNPERRAQKIADAHRQNIASDAPNDSGRKVTERSIIEGPNPAVRNKLYEWYKGKCQICGNTWPQHDKRPYFIAAYLVERQDGAWLDNAANAICLCADHFAQWRHASKGAQSDPVDQIMAMKLVKEGGHGELQVRFSMLGKDCKLVYCEPHVLALRKLIDVSQETPQS